MIGSKDIRDETMELLDNDDEFSDLLTSDGVIAPANVADEVDADVLIAVGVSRLGSDRENTSEETTFTVRVIVSGTSAHVDSSNGLDTLEKLKDRAAHLLTEQREERRSDGISGDEEIAWNENVNRHIGVVESETIVRKPR